MINSAKTRTHSIKLIATNKLVRCTFSGGTTIVLKQIHFKLALLLSVGALQLAPQAAWSVDRLACERIINPAAAVRDNHHFPENFTAADKAALIKEFVDDGRPILVVTDAYEAQKSGVVTVMKVLKEQVEKLTEGKVSIHYTTPDQFHPQIKVKYQDLIFSYMSTKKFDQIVKTQDPQAVHVMVEGTLGTQARRYLLNHDIPFTTAYHTVFPEYVHDMVQQYFPPLAKSAEKLTNASLRKFHSASDGVLVPTKTMSDQLVAGGYDPKSLRAWSHGVDTDLFTPAKVDPNLYANLPRPISLFIGRVAVEKNIEDFLKMKIPGTKVVVGSGPELEALRTKYPDAVFVGRKNYEELPAYYASADAFVFPSLTDTFGLVQLEANASGIPVVAYKVRGPVDVITAPEAGSLAPYSAQNPDQNIKNLEIAWNEAITLPKAGARAFAEKNTWEKSTLEFLWFLKRLQKDNADQQ